MVTDQTQTGYQWLIFIEVQRSILLSLFSFLHSSLQKSAVSLWMCSKVFYLCQDLDILTFDTEQSKVCRIEKPCWQQCGVAQKQKTSFTQR